jgi:type I restriction enzyme, S subunit
LNEQKQVVILRYVTGRLAADTPVRASGIPWVGDIPSRWRILRAKYLFHEVDERSTSGGEELLSVSHLTGVTPRSEKNVTMFKAESYVGHKICRPRDLVINTMWAWMGALGVSKQEGIVSPAYAVYRPREANHLLGEYVDLLLRTRPYTANFICRSTGVRASRLRLYPEEFLKIPVIIPPEGEQRDIIDSIRTETQSLSDAIKRTEREIALIQEYRTRLIADIVTGKLDVCDAAARLPDFPIAPESSLDADALGGAVPEEPEIGEIHE